MEAAVLRQFLDFFQDFLCLCQTENWPTNETSEEEIKNAFVIANHIESCLNKLHKKDIVTEFLTILQSEQDFPDYFLKTCFADPQNYVLKKIIQSQTKIIQMDIAFKIFLEMFSKEKLEKCLADIMLETASKETLLRHIPNEIPKEKILEFKSQILLSELNSCEHPKDVLLDMFNALNQDNMNLLVISIINKDVTYLKSVNSIVNVFTDVISRKSYINKSLWKYLFSVDEKYFLQLCIDHMDLFKLIVRALVDCGRLLKENMSAEFFYIDLTYTQLVGVVKRICVDENLKSQRARSDAVHSSTEVRSGGVPSGACHQRGHHRRRHRHQPATDCRKCLPEARLRTETNSTRQSG
ncbi:uncharacterized protein Ufm1 isoform X1 [Plodia interpunctella]|uniref:uncharacterized protein Ufm1 isoform X1 n=1 Tax=Plodia interpunctella TaxID=58824 RepID=UPI002367D5E0|nr:uncharacterized protein LOC128678726 isoform X1 [Plodia interpunctella]